MGRTTKSKARARGWILRRSSWALMWSFSIFWALASIVDSLLLVKCSWWYQWCAAKNFGLYWKYRRKVLEDRMKIRVRVLLLMAIGSCFFFLSFSSNRYVTCRICRRSKRLVLTSKRIGFSGFFECPETKKMTLHNEHHTWTLHVTNESTWCTYRILNREGANRKYEIVSRTISVGHSSQELNLKWFAANVVFLFFASRLPVSDLAARGVKLDYYPLKSYSIQKQGDVSRISGTLREVVPY